MIRLDKTKIYIIAVVVTLILAGIGYAFLSSDLSLNGVINVKKHNQKSQTSIDEQPICKRATTLHEETCERTDSEGCKAVSGDENTITYGSLGTTGTLTSGDAFDCDVNGDGEYNSSNERFYYISSLETDNNYGVLIYYNNVSSGSPNNTATYAYDSAGTPSENGPETLLPQLPTTSQWKNIRLSNTTRKIKDSLGTECTDFSYEGYAARLLTTQEVESACNITIGRNNKGELDTCKYLLENTQYSNYSLKKYWWLEDLVWSSDDYVFGVYSSYRCVGSSAAKVINEGVRPAIEVQKSKIEY